MFVEHTLSLIHQGPQSHSDNVLLRLRLHIKVFFVKQSTCRQLPDHQYAIVHVSGQQLAVMKRIVHTRILKHVFTTVNIISSIYNGEKQSFPVDR